MQTLRDPVSSILSRRTVIWMVILLIVSLLLLLATPISVRSQPTSTTLTGLLTILYGDPVPGQPGQPVEIPYLVDSTGTMTALKISTAQARLNSRKVIRVSGTLGADGALDVRSIAPAPYEAANLTEAPSALVTGTLPWVSVLCRYADATGDPPYPRERYQDMLGNDYPALGHYWTEASYGLLHLDGSLAVGWVTLPHPQSYYLPDGNINFWLLLDDCTRAVDDQVHFPTFDGINLIFDQSVSNSYYYWGSPGWGLERDGQMKVYHVTWLLIDFWETVLAHEMGHGYGMPHSSSMYPGLSGGYPYDSTWDVMSNPYPCQVWHTTFGCVPQGTIAYHLGLTGWLPDSRRVIVEVGTSQTVRLERLRLPQSSTAPLVVQVPIVAPVESKFLTIEARQRIADNYEWNLFGSGIIIHEVEYARSTGSPAQVMEMDNNIIVNDDGALWTVGEEFVYRDDQNWITVNVLSGDASGFTVQVTNHATRNFYRGINFNGPPLIIDGNQWEGSKTAPNLVTNGWGLCNQRVKLQTPTDPDRARMLRCAICDYKLWVRLNNVPVGTYDVYLYVWENDWPEEYSIFLESVRVVTNYNSIGRGYWDKLGPFRLNITDGDIKLTSRGWFSNLSGIEVWRVDLGPASVSQPTEPGNVEPAPTFVP
jgi:M6 family metalloprotease-like protein